MNDLVDQLPDEEIITEESEEETLEDLAEAEEATEEEVEGDEGAEAEESEEQEETLETVEIDGVEYEVPEALKRSIMLNKDYTHKTQAIAEEKRLLEEQRQLFEQTKERTQEDLKFEAQLYQLEDQLKQYETLDWANLEQTSDPDTVNSHWRQFQLLKDRKNDLNAQVKERQTQRSQEAQQAVAKRIEDTRAFAEKNIEGWSPALANEIEAYAISQGYSQESLLTNLSPALLKTLHDGYQGNKLLTKAKTLTKPKATIKPTKKVGAKSSGTTRVDFSRGSVDAVDKALSQGRNPRMSDL